MKFLTRSWDVEVSGKNLAEEKQGKLLLMEFARM